MVVDFSSFRQILNILMGSSQYFSFILN